MPNLTKLEFVALDISGKNYLSWILDAEIHLTTMNLGNTIQEKKNQASQQDYAKAMIFLRHNLDEGLKNEYLTIKDPLVLWKNLKEIYDHQKTVILPKSCYDWMHLRLQDFRTIAEYNYAIFKISSKLQLCGEKITELDMLEKTYSIFHVSNVLLQQQYRERRFAKYYELISCLLVTEQNNELLPQNHQSRPTGSTSIPGVNVASSSGRGSSHGRGRGRGSGSGRWRWRGCGQNNYQSRGGHINTTKNHKKWSNNIA